MVWLDIVLLVLIGVGLIKGIFDGFIKQTVSIIALVLGILYCGEVGEFIQSHLAQLEIFPEKGLAIFSDIIGAILIIVLLSVCGMTFSKTINSTPLGIFDHIFGGLFGVSVTLILLSLSLNIITTIDKDSVLIRQKDKQESALYEPVKNIFPRIFPNNGFIKGKKTGAWEHLEQFI